MTAQVEHCVYSALSKTVRQYHGLELDASAIFHLLGGYTFELKEIGNEQVPVYQVFGNKIRYTRFAEGTGIKLQRVYERDLDKAKDSVLQRLAADGYALVFTNCFYLPYDTLNYRRNAESHLLLIHSYEEETHEFRVSDSFYDNVQIHEEALWEACFKVYPRPDTFHLLHMERYEVRSADDIEQATKAAIQSQAQAYLAANQLHAYQSLLKRLDQLDGIYRRFACEAFAKELRHPHGMVTTRQLLSESCGSLSSELGDKYGQLAELWNAFSIPLIRFSHRALPLEALLEKFDEIMEQELSCSEQLQQLL